MNTLTLNINLEIFDQPPVYLFGPPVYAFSDVQDQLSLECRFKTTPLSLISMDQIIRFVLKENNIPIFNYPIYDSDSSNDNCSDSSFEESNSITNYQPYTFSNVQLFIEVFDVFAGNPTVDLHPNLDGYTYLYVTAVTINGFWRQTSIFTFDLHLNGVTYNVRVLDVRDYYYSDGPFSAGAVDYPNFRFLRVSARDTNEQAIIVNPVDD